MVTEEGQAVYGRVSSVFLDSEKGDVFVNVVTGPNREPREMKFSSPKSGIWYVPTEGDIVEVHNINGEKVARFPASPPDGFGLPEDLTEGDVCFKLNQDTQLHFSVQEDGTVDVELSCDGRLSISATEGFEVIDSDGYGLVEDGVGTFSFYTEDFDFKSGPKPQ